MADTGLAGLVDLMAKTKVEQMNIVTFAGRALKLDSKECAQEIVDAINNAKDLQALCLEGNTVGLEAAKAIADALKNHQEFERALWSDMFTGRLRAEIPPSLNAFGDAIIFAGAKLTVLDLSDNAFGPDGVKGIQTLLTSPSCYSLHTLKLNNNGLGIGGGRILSKALIQCHKAGSLVGTPLALKVFISGRNRLENEGATALAAAFKTIGTLEQIQMPQNGILHQGIMALADSFSHNKHLKVINLNDNTSTEKGALALSKAIPNLTELVTLNLGDCLLRDSGAAVIAEACKDALPSIEEMILSFNEIRRDGGMAIVNSIANKDHLKMLNLDGNQLGEQVEEIKDRMEELGRTDALGPFEDNEEPDSDEEGDGEDDEDENDEDNGNDSVEEDPDEADVSLAVEGLGLSNDSPLLKDTNTRQQDLKDPTVTHIEEFFSNPQLQRIIRIPSNQRSQLIKEYLQRDATTVDDVGRSFVTATCAVSSDATVLQTVADSVLSFGFASDRFPHKDIASALLVHLGLLKSESKVDLPVDIAGPLCGLTHCAKQSYFPKAVASHFIVFLTRASKLLDAHNDERHLLLQQLYKL